MKKLILIITIIYISAIGNILHSGELKRFPVKNTNKGVNTRVDRSKSGKPYILKNLLTDESVGFTTRSGCAEISSYPRNIAPDKIWAFKKTNGEEFLICQSEQYLDFTQNKTAWTEIRDDLSWELNDLHAAIIDNKVFFTNGVEDAFYFDGSLIDSEYYDEVDIPTGKYILSDKNKLFVANTYDYPSRIYFNYSGSDPTIDDNWYPEASQNYETIGYEDGDNITALASFGNNQTIITKENSIWVLAGYSNGSWGKPTKITSNYGCQSQETIQIVDNILYFVDSNNGVVGYNGASFDYKVDSDVRDDITDSNSVIGEYAWLQITDSSEFDDGSGYRMEDDYNELENQTFDFSWDNTNFNEGTSSNTTIQTFVRLSTSSKSSLTKLKRDDLDFSISHKEYLTWKWDDWWTRNKDGERVWKDRGEKMNFTNAYNAFYNATDSSITSDDYMSSHAGWKNKKGVMWGAVGTHHDDNSKRLVVPYYTFTITPTSGEGISAESKINKIKFTGNLFFDDFRLDFWYGDDVDLKDFAVNQWAHIRYTYVGAPINKSKDVVALQKRQITASRKFDWLEYYWHDNTEPSSKIHYYAYDGNDFTVYHNKDYKVSEVEITIYCYPTKDNRFWRRDNGLAGNVLFPTKIPQIYDISVYKNSTEEVYETSGYYISKSTKIASYNVLPGSATFDDTADYDNFGTSVTYRVGSSTDNINWHYINDVDTECVLSDEGLPAGKYFKWISTLTTTKSTETPSVTDVDMEFVAPISSWTDTVREIPKVDGGWSYAKLTSELPEDTTAIYEIRTGTGDADVKQTSYSEIHDGELINGTTNETYIQTRIKSTTSSGGKIPSLQSFTLLYAPEAEPTSIASMSKDNRYYLFLSTGNDDYNNIGYVLQRNGEWTTYDGWTPSAFCNYNNDWYMADMTTNTIYEIDTGTTDANTRITSQWKRYFDFFDSSFDKWLKYIYTTGVEGDGNLEIAYTVEDSTNGATDTIDMSGSGRFKHRHRIKSSGVQSFDIEYKSTAPISIYGMDLWYRRRNQLVP